MASKDQSGVLKDWEGPSALGQAYNTVDRLINLLAASSQDDVQPSSILALRSVGTLCIVDEALCGAAVDALDGNESVRLRDTKVLLGYRKGLTVKEIRESSDGVRGFLLAAALKLCGYDENPAGEIISYMAPRWREKEISFSPRQLSSLLSVLSGPCETVLSKSADITMSNLLNSLCTLRELSQCAQDVVWCRPQPRVFSEIISKALSALRDDDIEYMEIWGSVGLFWITLFLSWLNKDAVGMFACGRCILGDEVCKLRLIFTGSIQRAASESRPNDNQDADWEFHTWKKGSTVCEIVAKSESFEFIESARLIPAFATKDYYRDVLGSEEAVEMLGSVAHAYITVALDYPVTSESYIQNPLKKLIRTHVLQNHVAKHSLGPYGWDSTALFPDVAHLIEELRNRVRSTDQSNIPETHKFSDILHCRNILQNVLNNIPQMKHGNDEEGWTSAINRTKGHLANVLNRLPGRRRTTYSLEISETIHSASLSLAAQALLRMFVRSSEFGDGSISTGLLQHFDVDTDFSPFWDSTFRLPIRQYDIKLADIDSLRAAILSAALDFPPQLPRATSSIAISRHGRIAVLAPVMHPSLDKKGILDVYVHPGIVLYEKATFTSIVEELGYSTCSLGELHTMVESADHLATVFRTDGDDLRMRTAIAFQTPKKTGFAVTYTMSISQIASTPQVDELSEEEQQRFIYEDQYGDSLPFPECPDLWRLVRQHVLQLNIQSLQPSQKLLYIDIDPRQVTPEVTCVTKTLKVEIQFFLRFPGARNSSSKPYIQGNVSLEDCQTIILRRLFFAGLSYSDIHHDITYPLRNGRDRDALIQAFAMRTIQSLPEWRIIVS